MKQKHHVFALALLVQAAVCQAQPREALKKAHEQGRNVQARADTVAPPPAVPLPPPPPALTLVGGLPREQRGLLVLSAGLVKWSSAEKFNPAYQFLQDSGASLTREQLSAQYDSVLVLEGPRGTVGHFHAALARLAAGYQAVDVIIHCHGSPGELLFEDGRFKVSDLAAAVVNGGWVDVVAPDAEPSANGRAIDVVSPKADPAKLPGIRLRALPPQDRAHLRAVYETACFGASHIDAWLQMGFDTAAGARAVHSDSFASLPTFLNWWGNGYTFGESVAAANRADANQSYDKWLKVLEEFKGVTVNSQRDARGRVSASVSDGRPVTPSAIADAGREKAKAMSDDATRAMAEFKNTGDKAAATIESTVAAVGTPPNSFDAEVGGFHVRLESGTVQTSGPRVGMGGTVSIWPTSNPSLRMTVRDAAVTVRKDGSRYVAVGGAGRIEMMAGGQSVAFSDADFDTTPDGSTINGSGEVQGYGYTFDASYTMSAQNFSGKGEARGRSNGWQSVPGVEVEYQVSNPRLEVSFSGATASATFDAEKVEARTKARNLQGDPVAKAGINPGRVTISADGRVQLPMPAWPEPPDPGKTARQLCENLAREARQDTRPCSVRFPPPAVPSLPSLPRHIEIALPAPPAPWAPLPVVAVPRIEGTPPPVSRSRTEVAAPRVSLPRIDVGTLRPAKLEADVAIVDVKDEEGKVVVTVKNVGNAPTNRVCFLMAKTYQYDERISGPNKWEPSIRCWDEYRFEILLPGSSQTIRPCGISPDAISPGWKQWYFVEYHCGGESNDANNHHRYHKEPSKSDPRRAR